MNLTLQDNFEKIPKLPQRQDSEQEHLRDLIQVVRPNDRPRRRKFSIALHGESGAKRLAAKARRSAIAVMSD